MIPLDKIGEYTLVCERFNIECSIQNKLDMLEAVRSYLQGYISLGNPSMITGITKQELLAYCRKHIAKYAMPYDIEFREELPKTLVGKVAYRVLEDEEKAKLAARQPEEA